MKLVCDSCGTKYSIGDDRVAGKVFKIRCKKCANVMVVRGGTGATSMVEQAPPTEPIATIDEWHAVIEGAQSGPFSRVELLRKHASGELDGDSFVWREGLLDWVALGSLEELRAELAASAPANEATAVTAAPAPVADAPRLLAERNESSVLFTLGNLAKLASTPAKASSTTSSTGGTEGSGLIDIRALASSFAPLKPAKAQGAIGSADDLPVYAPATFGEPIVFVPPTRSKGPDRRLLIALLATVAMLAVLAVALVIVLRRDPEPVAGESTPTRIATAGSPVGGELGAPNGKAPTTQNGTTPNGTTPDGAPTGTTPTGTTPNGTAPTAPNGTAPEGTTPNNTAPNGRAPNGTAPNGNAPTGNTIPTTRTTPTTPPTNRTTPANSSRTTPTTPTRTPTLIPEKESNSCTDVSCAINDYKEKCCEKFKPRATNTITPPTGKLNENLDRNQLAAGIATIRAQACGGRSSAKGDVSVSVKISAEGVVTGVTIKSSPDPVLSACVTQAAQKGTFAKTSRGGSFSYMWRF